MSNVEYPRIISNAPCGADLLEGHSHQRIAEQIAKLLEEKEEEQAQGGQNEQAEQGEPNAQCEPAGQSEEGEQSTQGKQTESPEEDGQNTPYIPPRLIGLDGKWGSGKSNIIAIAKKMARGRVLFFTYNVWGHQSDPLRRSILEELTEFVTREGVGALASDKKRKEWEEEKESLLSTRKEVDTKTTPKVSARLLISGAIIMLTPVFSAIGEILPNGKWRAIVMAPPLLLALLVFIVTTFRKIKDGSLKALCNELLSIHKRGPKEESTHEEIYTSEPSSTQFKKWISDLDKDLQLPLAIVFDDIDRLPASKVQEFWAAIHTLFSNSDNGEASPLSYQHIRVIVPFDRQHIISAFKEENVNSFSSEFSVDLDEPAYHEPGCYGNDFIDKTFDVVYRVAPVTLSDQKGYLALQWGKSFGVNLGSEDPVTQIFDILSSKKTPRGIVVFVNECVAIRETCSPKIPEEYIALFVVGKHLIMANPEEELLNLEFCDALSYKYDNKETREYLAAIYYQLEPDKALEIIYVDQLRRELEEGKPDLLRRLIARERIFESTLGNVIPRIINTENAVNAFSSVQKDTPIHTHFWDELCLMAYKRDKDPESESHVELIKHASEEVGIKYTESLVHEMYKIATLSDLEFDACEFYFMISEFIKSISEVKHVDPMSFLHEVSTTAYRYVLFVGVAGRNSKSYKIHCDETGINFYLSDMCDQEYGYSNDYEGAVCSLAMIVESPEMATELLSRLIRLETINKTELFAEEQIVLILREAKKGSFLYHCLICLLIAKGGSNDPEINTILENGDEELAQTLATLINHVVYYDDLLLAHNKLGGCFLYKRIIEILMEQRPNTINTNAEDTLPRHHWGDCITTENPLANKLDGRIMNVIKTIPHCNAIANTLGITLPDLLRDWSSFNFQGHVTEDIVYALGDIPEYIDLFADILNMNYSEIGEKGIEKVLDSEYCALGIITPWTIPQIPVQFFVDTNSGEFDDIELVAHCREMAKTHLQDLVEVIDWETAFSTPRGKYKLLIMLWRDNPNAREEVPKAYEAFTKMVREGVPFVPGVQEELTRLFGERGYLPLSH